VPASGLDSWFHSSSSLGLGGFALELKNWQNPHLLMHRRGPSTSSLPTGCFFLYPGRGGLHVQVPWASHSPLSQRRHLLVLPEFLFRQTCSYQKLWGSHASGSALLILALQHMDPTSSGGRGGGLVRWGGVQTQQTGGRRKGVTRLGFVGCTGAPQQNRPGNCRVWERKAGG
jgi:hypothetical protein